MGVFLGGPRDGDMIEPEHQHADEVKVRVSGYDSDGELIKAEEHEYTPDAFGNLIHRGLVES